MNQTNRTNEQKMECEWCKTSNFTIWKDTSWCAAGARCNDCGITGNIEDFTIESEE